MTERTLTNEEYKLLEEVDILGNGYLSEILNENGYASWTVCPCCHVDDFCHVEGCELQGVDV